MTDESAAAEPQIPLLHVLYYVNTSSTPRVVKNNFAQISPSLSLPRVVAASSRPAVWALWT